METSWEKEITKTKDWGEHTILRWKKITEYDRKKKVRMQKQKIYEEIYRDILREKKTNTKKRLRWAHNHEMKKKTE